MIIFKEIIEIHQENLLPKNIQKYLNRLPLLAMLHNMKGDMALLEN